MGGLADGQEIGAVGGSRSPETHGCVLYCYVAPTEDYKRFGYSSFMVNSRTGTSTRLNYPRGQAIKN